MHNIMTQKKKKKKKGEPQSMHKSRAQRLVYIFHFTFFDFSSILSLPAHSPNNIREILGIQLLCHNTDIINCE